MVKVIIYISEIHFPEGNTIFSKPFNGVQLKMIASISMLIDHICAVFFSFDPAALLIRLTIGRIAMPVYIFLLCEGFFHTRSRKKYGLALFITALISEPIYSAALYGSPWELSHQNVCFTLLAGFLMLCIMNELSLKNRQLLHLPVIAIFCLAAYFLNFSYDYPAMLAFAALYYLHWHKSYIKGLASSAVIAVFESTPGAFLAAVPLSLYNGKRGRINTAGKYLFYAFYPTHLLALYVIKALII
jgi:hypothetical protein